MKIVKEHWQRYIWSSAVTFMAVFVPVLINDISILNAEVATLSAIGVVLLRAAFKAFTETVMKDYEKRS